MQLELLQSQVVAQRSQYVAVRHRVGSATVQLTSFDINDNCLLNRYDGSHTLTLEVKSSIECVMLQSDVKLELLTDDTQGQVTTSQTPCPYVSLFLLHGGLPSHAMS